MSDFLSAAEYKGPGEINPIYRQADEIGRLRAERDALHHELEQATAEREAMRGGMESAIAGRNKARSDLVAQGARGDRLQAELGRLVKERDDLAKAIARSAAPLRPVAPEGVVYHLPGGGTVTITPGR